MELCKEDAVAHLNSLPRNLHSGSEEYYENFTCTAGRLADVPIGREQK
jgi:hypothetical protein